MLDRKKYYQKIREYYRDSNLLYKYVWYQGDSLGLHFGFADKKTKNHTEALINQYKYVIEKGKIEEGMSVLDAGCGVGGAAIYIAQQTKAKVWGITLVKEQADEARVNAKKAKLAQKVKFVVGDYTKTEFKNESFDVVFGMESICYSEPRSDFLKEAYRLLKPGGVLVLTDGYRKREIRRGEETVAFSEFLNGWRLNNLVSYKDMARYMKEAKFSEIMIEDKTDFIEMSLNKMRALVRWHFWGEIILGWIKLPIIEMMRLNKEAMRGWIYGVEAGLLGYYGHIGRKSKK